MRTTLDIDEDVLEAVRSLAEQRKESMGKVLSDLTRKSLRPKRSSKTRNGVPLFEREPDSAVVTLDTVNRLRDSEGLE